MFIFQFQWAYWHFERKNNTSITSYLTKVMVTVTFASIVHSWWKSVPELRSLASFYKCMGKYQHRVCNTLIPESFPLQTGKGVSSLCTNTVTRDAYLKDSSSFNEEKNRRQGTVDENLIFPMSSLLTFPSVFLNTLDLTIL